MPRALGFADVRRIASGLDGVDEATAHVAFCLKVKRKMIACQAISKEPEPNYEPIRACWCASTRCTRCLEGPADRRLPPRGGRNATQTPSIQIQIPPNGVLGCVGARGLAGTLGFHASAVAALVLATILGARQPLALSMMPVTVGAPVVEAAPPPPVFVRTGPALDTVDASPSAPAVFSTDGGFSFDTSRIRAHRNLLFPFLTGELSFLDELRQNVETDRRRLHSPLGGTGRRKGAAKPLTLSAGARAALIDRAWARRDRWKSLKPIADLTSRYDSDDGDLPAVVRGHVERNLLQPYVESLPPDPRFWVMLGLAADHVDVVEFVGRYARQHPSSRTTTELLFLLDELAQASSDAWDVLMDTNVDSLALTRAASADNLALARQLQRGYTQWARDHAVDAPQALDERFDSVRLALLTTIVETSPGGYGSADARFLAGRLLWNRNDLAGAVRMWREMGTDERQTYAEARAAIQRAIGPNGEVDVLAIVGALGAERSRWLRESSDRLARFGYTPSTF